MSQCLEEAYIERTKPPPLSKEEMRSLPESVSAQMRASIDRFFSDHVDA